MIKDRVAEKSRWAVKIKKFTAGHRTHRSAAKSLGVGVETLRAWIYEKNLPGKITREAITGKIRGIR